MSALHLAREGEGMTNDPMWFEEMNSIGLFWGYLLSFSIFRWMYALCHKIFVVVFIIPMFYLWVYGPAPIGYGGQAREDICAHMTHMRVGAAFWAGSEEAMFQCNAMIMAQFNSFIIGTLCLVWIIALFFIILFLIRCAGRGVSFGVDSAMAGCMPRRKVSKGEHHLRLRGSGDSQ